MSGLPFAPLTIAELNTRVQNAVTALAWVTRACLGADASALRDGDLDLMRSHVRILERWYDAQQSRYEAV